MSCFGGFMKANEAWYIDDGVVVEGIFVRTLFHRVFFPRSLSCGFFSQAIKRSAIGKSIFFTENEAYNTIES